MVASWGAWKPFPNPDIGGHLDAPIGPGVFEVRHTMTGEQIAFAHSANVAFSLATLMPRRGYRLPFLRRHGRYRLADLEYRTCAVPSLADARAVTERMRGRREVYLRRRAVAGWA